MPLDPAILRDIESAEFAWELGLSGSRARAMRTLVRARRVRALMKAVSGNIGAADVVANRVVTLVRSETDPRYTHPFDAAIAAYLRTLDILFPDLASALGALVVRQRQNLWWSVPVVDSVLRGPVWTEGTADSVSDLGQKPGAVTRCATNESVAFPVPSADHFVPASARLATNVIDVPVDPHLLHPPGVPHLSHASTSTP